MKRLCVTRSNAFCCSRTRLASNSKARCELRVSRLPVGSSARITCGSLASARAMATRCCSPPERWRLSRSSLSPKSTASSKAALRSRMSASVSCPSRRIGIMTFSRALKSSIKKWNWKMKPISSLRRRANSSSAKCDIGSDLIVTEPPSG